MGPERTGGIKRWANFEQAASRIFRIGSKQQPILSDCLHPFGEDRLSVILRSCK